MSNECSTVVWKRDFGSSNRKVIAARLADHADDEGRGIWPSVQRVAAQCNTSIRTVQRVLSDFVTEGILVVVDEGGRGPGSTRRYDFDMRVVEALPAAKWRPDPASDATETKGDTVTPLEIGAEPKGVTATEKGVTGDTQGCHGDTQTSMEPPIEPSLERERGREGQEGGQPRDDQPREDQPRDDQPGTAAFDKRVLRFCSGRGFLAGPWPDFDTGASLPWIGRHFAKLTPAERAEAERWRDAYLLDVKDRKLKPVAVGNFFAGRSWEALDPAILARAEKLKQAGLAPDERARPDGWAACLGPVGMAWLFAELRAGQPAGTVEPGSLWLTSRLQRDWPAIHGWSQRQQMAGGLAFGPRWHALKDRMEPVPQGTEGFAAWRAHFARQGWPWLSAFDGAAVLYAPKGGPDGLKVFGQAVRDLDAGKADDGRQAAE